MSPFFGSIRSRKEFPLALFSLLGVDVFLTAQRGFAVDGTQTLTSVFYLAATIAGARWLRSSCSVPLGVSASVSAAVLLFLASNFAVWAR